MIGWIDSMGRTWGWQRRFLISRDAQAAMLKSPLGRLGEIGGDEPVFERLLGDALVFQRAFVTLNFSRQRHLERHYIDPRPVKAKAAEVGIADRTWWQRLDACHKALQPALDAQEAQQMTYAERAYAQKGHT